MCHPIKEKPRKSFSLKTLIENSSSVELDAYNQLQSDFSRARWHTHYNRIRQLYADVNASRKSIEVMIYHFKKNSDEKFTNDSFSKRDIEFILFLSKTLSRAEINYWSIELKMIELMWTVRKIAHMIKSFEHSTIIYIDHDFSSAIAAITKLITFNTNCLNMKLIRAFMYLFQFRLNIRHRSEKFNVISDALSRLSMKKDNNSHEALNLNLNHYQSKMKNSENDQIYAYVITLIEITENFRVKIKENYQLKLKWTNLMSMIQKLFKRREINNERHTEIDFKLEDDLLYHVISRKRLCIFANCETEIFRLAHDQNNHVEHNKIYTTLAKQIYISKFSRKIRQYVKHCSICELNQIKRHAIYEKLIFIFFSQISFRILTMNFIMILSNQMNTALLITCKTFKRMTIISRKFTWTTFNWTETLLERLLIANWSIWKSIISNRDSKFMFEFWRALLSKLETKLLTSIAYHLQTDEQSERINQTVKIALRFFLTKNFETDWVSAIFMIQSNFNNAFNVFTRLCSNQLIYDFKVRNIFSSLIAEKFENTSRFKILNLLNQIRLRNRQETTDVVSFVNAKIKIIHDRRHKSLFLNSEKKAFLRFHKKYNLFEVINRKLSQQRCDSFTVKRRVKRLTYKLELSKTWRIHLVIFVTQLESTLDDSYKRLRSNHSEFIFVEEDTETYKFYKIERILNKRTRQYENIKIDQYLIRWKEYESEFDEWKNVAKLQNCIRLVEDFEIEHEKTTSTRRRVKKSRLRKWINKRSASIINTIFLQQHSQLIYLDLWRNQLITLSSRVI
jgi:hypothetical protein